ncbi:hypothetical protein ACFYP4_02265 [Streptomyces sp. NPDC005551]|uniref:hypothetical protein n=1 Tax=Streptomyces sp. NPDC005551 TaxID=3364725 RepID=UPI00368E9D05
MTQQYPGQQPQQPQWGTQQPQYGPPPVAPKKKSLGKKIGLGCGGIFAVFVLIGIIAAVAGGGDDKDSNADKTSTSNSQPAKGDDKKKDGKPAPARKELSQAEQFKAFINKNGTASEKAAAKHITKVQGADKQNDILDAPEIYTDFSGGLVGPHQGEGKLLASAFADWKDSENGLVTVYDKDGELLANGNF